MEYSSLMTDVLKIQELERKARDREREREKKETSES
jgi:hypothetical protein